MDLNLITLTRVFFRPLLTSPNISMHLAWLTLCDVLKRIYFMVALLIPAVCCCVLLEMLLHTAHGAEYC